MTAELRLVPAIAGQRQTRRDPDRTLGGGTSAADFLCQRGQRQQVVVFVDGFVALNRLPSGSANKKNPDLSVGISACRKRSPKSGLFLVSGTKMRYNGVG